MQVFYYKYVFQLVLPFAFCHVLFIFLLSVVLNDSNRALPETGTFYGLFYAFLWNKFLTHSFNKYLVNAYYVSDTVQILGGMSVNKQTEKKISQPNQVGLGSYN